MIGKFRVRIKMKKLAIFSFHINNRRIQTSVYLFFISENLFSPNYTCPFRGSKGSDRAPRCGNPVRATLSKTFPPFYQYLVEVCRKNNLFLFPGRKPNFRSTHGLRVPPAFCEKVGPKTFIEDTASHLKELPNEKKFCIYF